VHKHTGRAQPKFIVRKWIDRGYQLNFEVLHGRMIEMKFGGLAAYVGRTESLGARCLPGRMVTKLGCAPLAFIHQRACRV
jgi:hypothetical protein